MGSLYCQRFSPFQFFLPGTCFPCYPSSPPPLIVAPQPWLCLPCCCIYHLSFVVRPLSRALAGLSRRAASIPYTLVLRTFIFYIVSAHHSPFNTGLVPVFTGNVALRLSACRLVSCPTLLNLLTGIPRMPIRALNAVALYCQRPHPAVLVSEVVVDLVFPLKSSISNHVTKVALGAADNVIVDSPVNDYLFVD